MRSGAIVLEGGFETLDRVEVIAAMGGSEPESNRRTTCRDAIAGGGGIGEGLYRVPEQADGQAGKAASGSPDGLKNTIGRLASLG